MSDADLTALLNSISKLHNTTDTTDRERTIRAIEISRAQKGSDDEAAFRKKLANANNNLIFGIEFPREETRRRITLRLRDRIENGMLNEVEELLNNGIAADDLIYYGLEYRYITLFITGKITQDEMFRQLETAIHQ